MITPVTLARFAPSCDASAVAPGLAAAATRYEINTPLRVAHWLAQLHVESAGFTHCVERMSYSAERLCQVWPSRFPNLDAATPYARNPQALAGKVYGGRMGNLNAADGFRYIGRGWIQLTGRDNYRHFAKIIGLDIEADPGLAATPEVASKIAGAYWAEHGLNPLADAGDIAGITKAINGGLTGLADRKAQLARAKTIFAP